MEKRHFTQMACRQTLILALSACMFSPGTGGLFQVDTHTLAKIPLASVLIFFPSLFSAPLCLYIIVSFGVALLLC